MVITVMMRVMTVMPMMMTNRLLRLKLPGADPPGDVWRRETSHRLTSFSYEYIFMHHRQFHRHVNV